MFEERLAHLSVEVNLASSLLDWIDNHGKGMMRKRKNGQPGKREENGKEATCVPNVNVYYQ